jgi:hypothetical protein
MVDHVTPPAPVRQWVLSLPRRLRGVLHRDVALAGRMLHLFLAEVERELRRHCPAGGAKARTGAVVPPLLRGIFHACLMEGLHEAETERVRFHEAAGLS